jgi:tRNA-dihydrouridine synthase
MLDRVFEEIDIKFSVKCRLGYFSPDEIEAIIPIFNKFPLSELIIHPRIGKQLYKGEADVERFKSLIPYINAPLVYNGDIFSVESFGRIHVATQPVNRFMLGRGLLTNPFLAEEIRGGAWNAPERTEHLHVYVIDLYEDRLRHAGGSPKVLGRMKELWSYLMYSFEEPQVVWRKIKKINALREYEEAVEEVFKSIELNF